MDKEVMKKYLEEVPPEVRMAILELKTDARWAVFVYLVLGGNRYFNEIKSEFSANANTINPILQGLVDGGLVARRIGKFQDIGDKRKIYYEATNMGKRLFDTLTLISVPPIVKDESKNTVIGVVIDKPKINRFSGQRETTNLPKVIGTQRV